MARAKSAVLSADDKKAVINDLKAQIAAAKTGHKASLVTVKDLNKGLLTAAKDAASVAKALNKELAAASKTVDASDKALAKLVASLAAIQAPSQAVQ